MIIKKFVLFWFPPFLWVFFIFFLSSQPHLKTNLPVWQDIVLRKLAHIFMYFILTFFYLRIGFQNEIKYKKEVKIISFIGAIIIAFLDEYNQSFVPGRSSSFYDVIFDAFGSLLMIKFYKKNKQS